MAGSPPPASRAAGRALDLLVASHPLPAAAVTLFAGALTAASGTGLSRGERAVRSLRAAAAVAAGQLAIGWANDALDAEADAAAGRTSGPGAKPVAAGRLSRRLVGAAAVLAVAAAVPLSAATGRRAGRLHLAALAAGLAYDLGLKDTAASPLPYAVFFGALPAVSAAAADHRPAPALCLAGGLLGVGAHFANTLKDAGTDLPAGVAGLPQRLGPARSATAAAGLVIAADAVVLLSGGLPPAARALLVASAATGGVGAALGGRTAFRAALASAALAVAGVVVGSGEVHRGRG